MAVKVQREDFDPGREIENLSAGNPKVGGVCSFIGLVRDMNEVAGATEDVGALTLEHYPGMTERALRHIGEHVLACGKLFGCGFRCFHPLCSTN